MTDSAISMILISMMDTQVRMDLIENKNLFPLINNLIPSPAWREQRVPWGVGLSRRGDRQPCTPELTTC